MCNLRMKGASSLGTSTVKCRNNSQAQSFSDADLAGEPDAGCVQFRWMTESHCLCSAGWLHAPHFNVVDAHFLQRLTATSDGLILIGETAGSQDFFLTILIPSLNRFLFVSNTTSRACFSCEEAQRFFQLAQKTVPHQTAAQRHGGPASQVHRVRELPARGCLVPCATSGVPCRMHAAKAFITPACRISAVNIHGFTGDSSSAPLAVLQNRFVFRKAVQRQSSS